MRAHCVCEFVFAWSLALPLVLLTDECVPSSTNTQFPWFRLFFFSVHSLIFSVNSVSAFRWKENKWEWPWLHCLFHSSFVRTAATQLHKDTLKPKRTYFQPQWDNLLHLYSAYTHACAEDNNACEPLAHIHVWRGKRAAHRLFRCVCVI